MNQKQIGFVICFVIFAMAVVTGNAQGQNVSGNPCQPDNREMSCSTGVWNPETCNCVDCLQDMDCLSVTCNLFNHECQSTVVCNGQACGDLDSAEMLADAMALSDQLSPPAVVVSDLNREDEKAPYMTTYSVSAKVTGVYARVTTEFTVYNPNARSVEGKIEFPLPDGAVITGYAIDVNGVMTDARVVPK